MHKQINKKTEGFTIIEVLIVLAIAGLILLLVFLAVPALQRNSRNTQRRNQIATYLGAVNEFVSNNNGNVPSTAAHVDAINLLAADGQITEYTGAPKTGAQATVLTITKMELVTKAKCDTTVTGNTVVGTDRQIAVRFAVEGSGGTPIPQCQET